MPDSDSTRRFLVLREDIVKRDLKEELVLYDPVTDQLALLNNSAAVAIDLCDGTRSCDDVVAEVAVLAPQCHDLAAATLCTLNELEQQGFLIRA